MAITSKSNLEDNQPINRNMFNNIQLNEKDKVLTPGSNSATSHNLHNLKNLSNNLGQIPENSNFIINNLSGVVDITQIIKTYAEIARNFYLYNCEEAINLIKQLPIIHQKSSWIMVVLGRCYFELTKYKDCDKVFKECVQRFPANIEGMDFYSSCLWYLKDQFTLVNLANSCLEQSHFVPETWIVVGNCHSLQKEHELALKFFNRAIQINHHYAYAFTLSGHEYVETENYSLAKQCYTNAINSDDR